MDWILQITVKLGRNKADAVYTCTLGVFDLFTIPWG